VPDGLAATFGVTIAAILCSLVIGLFAGLGRISHVTIINRMATVYVESSAAFPCSCSCSTSITPSTGPPHGGATAAVLAMSICYGAYMAEIFRAGIQAVPKGQMEAALALG
jgi:polar amino acid transport system permease protein